VCIELGDDGLAIAIRDLGPMAAAWTSGVGISSMRERAAEVGGTLQISGDQTGSQVRAVLPLG
jgi:signal transduction histidine kinase